MLKLTTKLSVRGALLAALLGTAGLALALSPAAAQRGGGGGFHGGGGGFHGGGFHGSSAFHSTAPRGFDRDRFGRFDRDDRFGRFGRGGFRGGFWWGGRWYGPGWGWGWGGWPVWWGGYYPYSPYYGDSYCSEYDAYYGYCAY